MLSLPSIDRSSNTPVWFQIMRAIEGGIHSGTWSPGTRLPSENEFCAYFGVSRTTVREALGKLEEASIVTRRQGKGAFVEQLREPSAWTLPSAPSLHDDLSEDGDTYVTSKLIRAGIEPLPPWAHAIADREGNGFVVERVRAVHGRTAIHVINQMPSRLIGLLPDLRDPRSSLYAALARVTGAQVSRMRQTVEARVADRAIAAVLEIEVGDPIAVVEAVAYDQFGQTVDFSRAALRTDRLRINVDSRFDTTSRRSGSLLPANESRASDSSPTS